MVVPFDDYKAAGRPSREFRLPGDVIPTSAALVADDGDNARWLRCDKQGQLLTAGGAASTASSGHRHNVSWWIFENQTYASGAQILDDIPLTSTVYGIYIPWTCQAIGGNGYAFLKVTLESTGGAGMGLPFICSSQAGDSGILQILYNPGFTVDPAWGWTGTMHVQLWPDSGTWTYSGYMDCV